VLRRVFAVLSRERRLGLAIASVLIAASVWAVLCLMLAAAGHGPSVTLLPIARGDYYRVQALFVVPLVALQWIVSAVIAHRVGRTESLRATASGLGPALAGPLLFLFVLPDLIAYQLAGFAALGTVVRVTGPLMLAAAVGLSTMALRAAGAPSGGRAFWAANVGVIVPAAFSGTFLR
jgi:hypothetical protein